MQYKWNSPDDWLQEKIEALLYNPDREEVIKQLYSYLHTLANYTDLDTMEDAFLNEMCEDGYFELQEGQIVIVCGAEYEDKQLIAKICGLKICKSLQSPKDGKWSYITEEEHSSEILASLQELFDDYDGEEEAYFEEAFFLGN